MAVDPSKSNRSPIAPHDEARTVFLPPSGATPAQPVLPDDLADTLPAAPPPTAHSAATVISTTDASRAAPRDEAPAIPPGTPLGKRYTIQREIGHGGMGTVLEGWDTAIGRPVALKILRSEAEASGEIRQRFLHEAEVTGRLEHPHIVPVHDLGDAVDPASGASRAFFCMKLIEGEDLASIVGRLESGDEATRREFSRTRLLQIFQDICMGIAFAHDRGVIHRDLKPGNIMIGRYGETLIVDWGLAKRLDMGGQIPRTESGRVPTSNLRGGIRDGRSARGEGDFEAAGDRSVPAPTMAAAASGANRTGRDPAVDAGSPASQGDSVSSTEGPITDHERGTAPDESLSPRDSRSPQGQGPTLTGDSTTALTIDGEILGTPAYMSPEQATGRVGRVDARSDVYSLGAILYELLVHRPPFEGSDAMAVVRAVVAGELTPPSQRVPRDPAAVSGGLSVPIELEWICLKAMARLPEDRYPTARVLHDEIQLYLEGVKEGERRRDLARARVEEGRRLADRLAGLKERVAQGAKTAKTLSAGVKPWHSIEEKRAVWRAEDGVEILRNELVDTFSAANGAFTAALSIDPENSDARLGKAALFWDRFLEAEESGNAEQMRINRGLVEQYDDGAFAERLKGDGLLTVRTQRYPCACLTRDDLPVRRHGAECSPVSVAGIEAWLFTWREVDRRLVASRPEGVVIAARPSGRPAVPVDPGLDFAQAMYLGGTPVEKVRLPMGRYLLVLSAPGLGVTRVPLHITRLKQEALDVSLYSPAEIGEGFIHIPAGPFVYSGDSIALQPERQIIDLPDVFISRVHVTVGEYLEFLNEIVRRDPAEAARRVPRTESHAGHLWLPGPDGTYVLPGPGGPHFPGASGPQTWDLRHPMTCVSGEDALAYVRWRGAKERRALDLPHEAEWEKAARGVDGRYFPWGDAFDAAFCNNMDTHQDGARILPVGAIRSDESPYGVRDLAGNARNWCRNIPQEKYDEWRAIRGGACMLAGHYLRSAYRFASRPATVHLFNGFRLVAHPGPAEALES